MLSVTLTFVFQIYTVDSISSQSHQLQCRAVFYDEVVWIGFQHTQTHICTLSVPQLDRTRSTPPFWQGHRPWGVLFYPVCSLAPRWRVPCPELGVHGQGSELIWPEIAQMAKILDLSAKKTANVLQLSLSTWEEQRVAQSARRWICACSVNCWRLECQYWA